MLYNFALDETRLKMHVTGLDSSVRLICQQIAQAQSAGLMLRSLLPELSKLNEEYITLQKVIDETDKAQVLNGKAPDDLKEIVKE